MIEGYTINPSEVQLGIFFGLQDQFKKAIFVAIYLNTKFFDCFDVLLNFG